MVDIHSATPEIRRG